MSFSGSFIMSSVDSEVLSVYMVPFNGCFEELWLVDYPLFYEKEIFVLFCNTGESEVVCLYGQVVSELPFFVQKIGFVSIVELFVVFGEGMQVFYFHPVSVLVSGQRASLDFKDFSPSQQPKSSDVIFEIFQIPQSRGTQEHW